MLVKYPGYVIIITNVIVYIMIGILVFGNFFVFSPNSRRGFLVWDDLRV
jgi:hypothetical protein